MSGNVGLPSGCGHSSEEKGQPSELDQVLYSCETPFVHLTSSSSAFVFRRVKGTPNLCRFCVYAWESERFCEIEKTQCHGSLSDSGESDGCSSSRGSGPGHFREN